MLEEGGGIAFTFHATIMDRCHATTDLSRAKNHPPPCPATHFAVGQKQTTQWQTNEASQILDSRLPVIMAENKDDHLPYRCLYETFDATQNTNYTCQ